MGFKSKDFDYFVFIFVNFFNNFFKNENRVIKVFIFKFYNVMNILMIFFFVCILNCKLVYNII